MMNKQIPTEAQEQTTLFQWAARMQGRYPELDALNDDLMDEARKYRGQSA